MCTCVIRVYFCQKEFLKLIFRGVPNCGGERFNKTTKAAGFILIHGFLTHSKKLRMCPGILFHERTAKSKMLTSPFKVHYLSAAMLRAGERERKLCDRPCGGQRFKFQESEIALYKEVPEFVHHGRSER